MNYKIISSCSTGNAVIIRDVILIDCGVTFKRLENFHLFLLYFFAIKLAKSFIIRYNIFRLLHSLVMF